MEPVSNNLFQDMYDEYKTLLRTIAAGYRIPYGEVDDIMQHTFISYLDTYSVVNKNRGPILVTILKHKCIDYYKKIHYESVSQDSEEGKRALEQLVLRMGADTERDAEKKELYQKVRQCISEMKAEWREVILYCCVLQYTSEEAGKILGISATACRSRLLRAREYIKKTLGDEFHEYFD